MRDYSAAMLIPIMADDIEVHRGLNDPLDGDENPVWSMQSSRAMQRLSYRDALDRATLLPTSSTYTVEAVHSPVDADREAAFDVHNTGKNTTV